MPRYCMLLHFDEEKGAGSFLEISGQKAIFFLVMDRERVFLASYRKRSHQERDM